MKKWLALLMLLPTLAWGADYALIVGAGVDLTASGVVVDGGGTYACVNVTGAGSSIGHATLANCAADALNAAESLSYSNSVTWCDTDADCTITIAADKILTGSKNAWRVAPAGDGTDSTTDNLTALAACPFALCYSNLKPLGGGPLINAAVTSAAWTLDAVGTRIPQGAAADIGAYEFIYGGGGGSYQHGHEMY
jgi:hypothetical protein